MRTPRALRFLPVVLLAAALGIALASCGDDDDDGEEAPETTTTEASTTTTTTTTTEAPTTTTTIDPLAIGEAVPTPLPTVMYPPDVGNHLGNRPIVHARRRYRTDPRRTLGS